MTLSSWVSSLLFYSYRFWAETINAQDSASPSYQTWRSPMLTNVGAYFSYRNNDAGHLIRLLIMFDWWAFGIFWLMIKTHEHHVLGRHSLFYSINLSFLGISSHMQLFPNDSFCGSLSLQVFVCPCHNFWLHLNLYLTQILLGICQEGDKFTKITKLP